MRANALAEDTARRLGSGEILELWRQSGHRRLDVLVPTQDRRRTAPRKLAPRQGEWAAARPPARDTASLRGDLLSLLRPWVRLLGERPYGRVIAALITEAQTDPAFAEEYRARFVEPRRDQAHALFDRAIERGEIPPTTNVELALDLLYGPLYHRLLYGHARLHERFAREVVDATLRGLVSPQAEQPDRPSRIPGRLTR